MFGSTILDVTIGLLLTYLVMALVCSAVNEGIASLFSFRAKFLEEGVRNLIGNGLAEEVFKHGLVQGLTRRKPEKPPKPGKEAKPSARHPSYLPAPVFAVTLLEAAAKLEPGKEVPKGVNTAAEVRKAIDAVPDAWLEAIPGDITAPARRVAYLDFFMRRLAHAHIFEREAVNARVR